MKSKFNQKLNQILDIDDDNVKEADVLKDVEEQINSYKSKNKRKTKIDEEQVIPKQVNNKYAVRIFTPAYYKDVKEIAQALVRGQVTYIYLNELKHLEANRIIDFLTGVVYGLGGDIERLDKELFICTPSQMEIIDEMRTRI